jgi:hypothetical protein
MEKELVGKRVRMSETMSNDPNPIQEGDEGTIYHVGGGVINVEWDSGRNLGLVIGEDQYQILN